MRLLVALLATFLLAAAPAFAQDPAPVCTGTGDATADCTSGPPTEPTVGDPEVITDPADEVEPPAAENPVDDDARAEQHVLSDTAVAHHHERATGSGSRVAETAAPAPAATPVAASTPSTASAGQLPFTGVDAWLLALAGSGLVAAGLAVRRLA
jgi:hypothetical protein